MNLGGVGVALVTPMNMDYSVDFNGLERLIEYVIDGDADYLVVLGTTGESPVFSWSDKLRILDFVLEKNAGRKPIVMGLGGNNTYEIIKQSSDLKELPLAAILSISPYYSKPSQKGIARHYTMLADAFPHPVILYNVPSRTGSNVESSTTLALSDHPNIIGMKEAETSGGLSQAKAILKNKPDDFLLIGGDDQTALELIQAGGQGIISVIANLLPKEFGKMINNALNGNNETAHLNQQLTMAYELASAEGSPTSIKTGLEAKGICARTVKPPLYDGSDELFAQWKHALKALKID